MNRWYTTITPRAAALVWALLLVARAHADLSLEHERRYASPCPYRRFSRSRPPIGMPQTGAIGLLSNRRAHSWSSCIRSDNPIAYVAFRRLTQLINLRSLAERHITMKTTEDLKIGKLTHQDLGQMQMYANYYDRHVKSDDEHPTVGIVLCRSKSGALVELTLPKNANIYASEYKLYLPSKVELKKKLMEWTRGES